MMKLSFTLVDQRLLAPVLGELRYPPLFYSPLLPFSLLPPFFPFLFPSQPPFRPLSILPLLFPFPLLSPFFPLLFPSQPPFPSPPLSFPSPPLPLLLLSSSLSFTFSLLSDVPQAVVSYPSSFFIIFAAQ